ncbi:Hypothetical protein A7982_02106 [Minicystis rosea]|nr:Hypothetical protein A7982_02106 [Minicystis rosea]
MWLERMLRLWESDLMMPSPGRRGQSGRVERVGGERRQVFTFD